MRSLASTLLRTLCKGSSSRAHGNVHILTTSAGTVCSTHLVLSQNTHATLTSNVVALCVRVCVCDCLCFNDRDWIVSLFLFRARSSSPFSRTICPARAERFRAP
uniref:Uncharacterized protein n=1 Tax=Anopheles quadriannulatus TaxID=34691 RepID=A0A182XQU8_ANOQN